MTASEAADWRPILAALANPDSRRVIGLLIVGEDPRAFLDTRSPSRRRHILSALTGSGLVAVTEDGALRLDDTVFPRALAGSAAPRPVGVDRFLRDGRVVQYPSSPAEREALLRRVAAETLEPGEVVDERTMNERLLAFSDDTAVLRRHLVDFGIVERRSDGTEYALVAETEHAGG